MPLTVKMVASEILMCGLKRVPIAGLAIETLDSIRLKHELVGHADRLAEVEGKLSRFERAQRDLVANEMRTILANFRRRDLSGPSLSEEIRNLRQIQEQGWTPSLFEGLFLNSSHLEELKRNPHHYGRILGDHDVVDPEKGIHVLLDADKTRIVELAPFAFSQLLANQSQGVPDATIHVGEGVWAFPTLENRAARSPANDKPATRPGSGRTVFTPRAMLADSHADTIATTIGMKLKLIPAGEFQMGSTEADDEKPRHLVTITQPFYLGVCPVTQREYMQVVKKNPSHFSGNDHLPVESVSWFDAVAFCNALSQKEGLPSFYKINGETVQVPDWSGPGYRLPTEAEWEYACRAGTTTRFSSGDDENALGPYAWYSANSSSETHPVGEKEPNAFGLHDMHGNVWEWCWDGFEAGYYARSPAEDPRGPATAAARVVRGGSWRFDPRLARSAYRAGFKPEDWRNDVGFRVARVPGNG